MLEALIGVIAVSVVGSFALSVCLKFWLKSRGQRKTKPDALDISSGVVVEREHQSNLTVKVSLYGKARVPLELFVGASAPLTVPVNGALSVTFDPEQLARVQQWIGLEAPSASSVPASMVTSGWTALGG